MQLFQDLRIHCLLIGSLQGVEKGVNLDFKGKVKLTRKKFFKIKKHTNYLVDLESHRKEHFHKMSTQVLELI